MITLNPKRRDVTAAPRPRPIVRYAFRAQLLADARGHALVLRRGATAIEIDKAGELVEERLEPRRHAALEIGDRAFVLGPEDDQIAIAEIASFDDAAGSVARIRRVATDGVLPVPVGEVVVMKLRRAK